MDADPSPHPTDQALGSFGLGKLDDASAEAVNKHLEDCVDCRKRVAALSSDSFLDRVRDARKAPGPSEAVRTQTYNHRDTILPSPSAGMRPPGLEDHPDYEIKRELGRGGMGVVYLAHNKLMARDEVLKVMGRQIMDRPGVLDRFLREIRAVAKLRHPNIVTAYSAVRIGESIVFAMEYVEGLDLHRMVKSKGPLPVGHACNFVYQSALGLQHAHEEGLVHRDIKPGNLMLSRKGDRAIVKVLDFGLAKATREEKVDGGLTAVGQALGTPDFIAPEQILDAPSADIRADIYSLGGTLYYLLTGRPPFQADSLYDIYQAHISRDADPLNLVRPEVPAELAALVAKMMAKDPARRFQTPGEVTQALTPFFKKGNVTFKSPKADVSQASQTGAARPVTGPIPTPTQPAMDAGWPVGRGKKAAEPAVPEVRWESLIDVREAEEPDAHQPATEPTRRFPRWHLPVIVAGAGFLALFLGIIIKITIEKNKVSLEVERTDDSPAATDIPRLASPEGSRAGEERDDNGLKMKFCWCPPGTFRMGSPPNEPERGSDENQVDVRLSRGFWMGKFEVTQEQWQWVMTTTLRQQKDKGSWGEVVGEGPRHPMYFVNHAEAEEFCRKFTESERAAGRLPKGWEYRLPTEAQREYACRAGTTTATAFGDRLSSAEANFDGNSPYNGAPQGPSLQKTTPVGQYAGNTWGLCDMHGNVFEWCRDGYAASLPGGVDPLGPAGAAPWVIRGGSWLRNGGFCRSASRYGLVHEDRNFDLGFRVARVSSAAGGTGGLPTSASDRTTRALVGKPPESSASDMPRLAGGPGWNNRGREATRGLGEPW